MVSNTKICFFISSLNNAGGTERVCTAIANKLAELGYKISIISLYAGEPFFELYPNIRYLSIHQKKSFSKILIPVTTLHIRKKIKSIGPEILINVDSALFMYTSVAIRGLNIKNIIWEHFNYHSARHSIARITSRILAAKYSDAIVTLTKADRDIWIDSRFCSVPVVTINNPSPEVINTGKPTSKKNIVLSVGRLTHQKGFDMLLDTWRMVKLNSTTDWELNLIGSGEEKSNLEQLIKTFKIEDSVKLITATPHLAQHYHEADMYCLSSRYEGFPMVLLEAQAYGLPMVSFDCQTGPAEIIKHNQTGILVKNGDCIALANAITMLINAQEKRKEMSVNAKTEATKYSIDTIIKEWQKLFATI